MISSFRPNWEILEQLRNRFLSENFSTEAYWSNLEILTQYDHTFGQRIGWKWDSVLSELKSKNSLDGFKSIQLIDWGCGTGIASRKFLEHFGGPSLRQVFLVDKSPLAVQFAKESILQNYSSLKIETSLPKQIEGQTVLLISHVLNELSPSAKEELLSLIHQVDWVIWVEPGTPTLSRRLIEFRESLKNQFKIVAPCPHQKSCGLLKSQNSPHWCHFFASPPASIFRDSFWSDFSKRLKIDLRALPTMYLVLSKAFAEAPVPKRVLGRTRHYKGYSLALVCSSTEVSEQKFLQRNSKEVIDILKKNSFSTWVI